MSIAPCSTPATSPIASKRKSFFALAPHQVFYLEVDVDTITRRVLESRGMDYWESGMDLELADDIDDSFRTDQNKLLREYAALAREFKFHVIDARARVDIIQEELRRKVEAFLAPSP